MGGEERHSIHLEHLKPLLSSDTDFPIQLAPNAIHHADVKKRRDTPTRHKPKVDGTRYEVEAITGHRLDRDGRLRFKVVWVGYDKPTWEREINMNAPLLVREYINTLARASAIGKSDARAG